MRISLVLISLLFIAFGPETRGESVSSSTPVADVLLLLKKDPSAAYRKAESAYRSSKDPEVRARLSSILAFAPQEDVSNSSYFYAEQAFQKDKTLSKDLKVKLAKLAGEGLFDRSRFPEAEKVFRSALTIGSLSEEQREYFNYQIAWCELNRHRPGKAIQIFVDWLKSCRQCSLKKEMIADLGQSVAEAGNWRVKKGRQILLSVVPMPFQKPFMDGLAIGLGRQKKISLPAVSGYFAGSGFSKAWLDSVFGNLAYSHISACDRIQSLVPIVATEWPDSAAAVARSCAEDHLHKKEAKSRLQNFLRIYSQISRRTEKDSLLLGDLYAKAGDGLNACWMRIDSIQKIQSVAGSSADQMIEAALAACEPFLSGSHSGELSKRLKNQEIAVSVSRASSKVVKALLLNPAWKDFRFDVWKKAPMEISMDLDVLKSLFKALIDQKDLAGYAKQLEWLEQKSAGPSAKLAWLKAELFLKSDQETSPDSWRDLYRYSADSSDWSALSVVAQDEVLHGLIEHEQGPSFFKDWSVWHGRFSKLPHLYGYLVNFALKTDQQIPNDASDRDLQVIAAIQAWKRSGELKQSPTELATPDPGLSKDLSRCLKLNELSQTVNRFLTGGEMTSRDSEREIQKSFAAISRALRYRRNARWSIPAMGDLSRDILNKTLSNFEAGLRNGGFDGRYDQLAGLIETWRKTL